MREDIGYPIRVVARRTGLKQDLIRAWERRYGAVRPARSAGRHRLYSEEDIERLKLLRLATEAGHSIGRVAGLGEESLLELIAADSRDRSQLGSTGTEPLPGSEARLATCLAAVESLDSEGLLLELERSSVELGRIRMVDEVLAPLVEAIGSGCGSGSLRPVHEHAASSAITSFVQNWRSAFAVPSSAPRLVVGTPLHQHHELGAILAGAVAAAEGWQVSYIGANLPAEEIAAAAHLKEARAVALSLVFPRDDPLLAGELQRLRRLLRSEIALLVGGRATDAYLPLAEDGSAEDGRDDGPAGAGIGATVDFASFRRALAELRGEPRRAGSAAIS